MSGKKLLCRKPKFFKVMLGNFKLQLRIPPAFEKYMNGEHGRKVTLVGPDDRSFEVTVRRRYEGLFLRKGWRDFVDYHCLQRGEFLVFKYDGKSRFDVEIFARTGCRKEEKLFTKTPEKSSNGSQWRIKVSDRNEAETTNFSNKRKRKDTIPRSALEVAKAIESNPPSFNITVKPCHISDYCYLPIPWNFARENGFSKGLTMNLRPENGNKIWSVKVHQREDDRRFSIRDGWRAFCVDNNLKEGDECYFTLFPGIPMLMKFCIVKCEGNKSTTKFGKGDSHI